MYPRIPFNGPSSADQGVSKFETVSLNGDFSWVLSVCRIILELVGGIFKCEERIIDSDNSSVRILHGPTKSN